METLTTPPPSTEQTSSDANAEWAMLAHGPGHEMLQVAAEQQKHRYLARLNLLKKLSGRFGRHRSTAATAEIPIAEGGQVPKKGLKNKVMGSTAFASTAAEVAGIGVDAVLMGGGSAGVDLLKSVFVREALAVPPDITMIHRIQEWARKRQGHEVSEKEAQNKLKKFGGIAVTAVVAVAAQKAGLGAIEHLNEHSSALHFVAPLTTKVGAVTAARRMLRL
ncbi:MAG TPA: hypothetical protein VG964_04355 [Candidatus Saccharimonadales bacterium]|nr:hypothetical protein [Candidatus Saccharimonadales bacterium]